MGNPLLEAVERAIGKLVTDFQGNPTRFWNERDLHWSLFYYLKQEDAIRESYTTQFIRAEFPTLRKFGRESSARGHYDLVVLEPSSVTGKDVCDLPALAPWEIYLPKVNIQVAIELKLWLAKLSFDRAAWDIRKLTEPPNNVQKAYFLNFVQLDFSRPKMQDYYHKLREHMENQAESFPQLTILCVPSQRSIQPNPSDNWIL